MSFRIMGASLQKFGLSLVLSAAVFAGMLPVSNARIVEVVSAQTGEEESRTETGTETGTHCRRYASLSSPHPHRGESLLPLLSRRSGHSQLPPGAVLDAGHRRANGDLAAMRT